MKLTVTVARLVENRSDERDQVYLSRAMRDGVLNQAGTYYREVTTTDATPTVIWTDKLNPGSSAVITARVIGYASATVETGAYERRATFHRTAAGVAAQTGATQTPVADLEDDATWDVSLTSAADGTLSLTVTGAAKSIDWRAEVSALWTPLE